MLSLENVLLVMVLAKPVVESKTINVSLVVKA